jgi:hypothetical protein
LSRYTDSLCPAACVCLCGSGNKSRLECETYIIQCHSCKSTINRRHGTATVLFWSCSYQSQVASPLCSTIWVNVQQDFVSLAGLLLVVQVEHMTIVSHLLSFMTLPLPPSHMQSYSGFAHKHTTRTVAMATSLLSWWCTDNQPDTSSVLHWYVIDAGGVHACIVRF